MQTEKILSADLLDIIFDNRNKDYGAYELRKTYQKRITRAMLITGSITILIIGSLLGGSQRQPDRDRFSTTAVDLSSVKDNEPALPKPKKEIPQPTRTEQ